MRLKLFSLFVCILTVTTAVFNILGCSRKQHGTDNVHFYPGKEPHYLEISPDGANLYAATQSGIAVIDKNTMEKVDEILFPYKFFDMKIGPAGQHIYGTYPTDGNGTGHLSRIRLSDENVETIDLSPVNAHDLTFDDTGEYVYVCGGTWPDYDEGCDPGDYKYNMNTGRIFEVRTSDFTLMRTANVGIDNNGISYQDGKLVVMSIEQRRRDLPGGDREGPATTCHIIDAASLETEYTIGVNPGFYNTSYALPGDTYVMGGFNDPGYDGAGFGLINVNTGEVEHWYITDPNPMHSNQVEGGGFWMTVDPEDNFLYSTLYVRRELDQPHCRLGIINLSTNEYSDWLVEPFRLYLDILFDPTSGNLYLAAPLDDAIVVLEPPQ